MTTLVQTQRVVLAHLEHLGYDPACLSARDLNDRNTLECIAEQLLGDSLRAYYQRAQFIGLLTTG